MKLEFVSTSLISDVLDLLSDSSRPTVLIAGGYHTRLVHPEFPSGLTVERIVDLMPIKAFRYHREEFGLHGFGSLFRLRRLMELEAVHRHFPIILRAIMAAGPIQMRNQSTVGGHIVHNSEVDPVLGALFLLDAKIHYRTARQDMAIPVTDFTLSPRSRVLPPDGIIHRVYVSAPTAKGEPIAFYEGLGPRCGLYRPARAVLASAIQRHGTLLDLRIVQMARSEPMKRFFVPELPFSDLNDWLDRTVLDPQARGLLRTGFSRESMFVSSE